MKQLKVGSDFSGVGAFDQALRRLEVPYKTVFACDMDKYARQTYIHNYGEPEYYPENVYDREIPNEPLDIYMTSPPCQAFSLAGKRKGEADKRGILFYNSQEFIKVNNPRYFIFENVKGLLSDDGGRTFQRWLDFLGGKTVNGNPVIFPHEESVPYHIYWQVLNAKDYGVPQNRERVFIIGIRDDGDNNFSFPKPFPLVKRLKDVLETEVDEKYFLSEKMVNTLARHDNSIISNDTPEKAGTIHAGYFKMGGRDQQYIKVKSATACGYELATEEDSINFSVPNSETRRGRGGKGVAQNLDTACNQGVIAAIRGRYSENSDVTTQTLEVNGSGTSNAITTVQKDNVVIVAHQLKGGKWDKTHEQSGRVYSPEGIGATLHTMQGGNQQPKIVSGHAIRRLTPRECFRLMDFPDTFVDNIALNNLLNTSGIILKINNKTKLKWNVKQTIVKGNQMLKDCALCTTKGLENTEMKILNSDTLTEVKQNAQLTGAVAMFLQKDFVQHITTLIENGEILYTLKEDNLKLLNVQDKEFLNQKESQDLERKEKHCTDLFIKITLEESLKGLSKSTILTVIQTITSYLTYIYSLPKQNTLNVIVNFKNCAHNSSEGELLNLKMGGTILSDSQLYKQAGNSIVVNVLAQIISKLQLK